MIPRKLLYGVWNGVKYDNTQGGDEAPEGLNLSALTNFNPGNPIDAFVGAQGFLAHSRRGEEDGRCDLHGLQPSRR